MHDDRMKPKGLFSDWFILILIAIPYINFLGAILFLIRKLNYKTVSKFSLEQYDSLISIQNKSKQVQKEHEQIIESLNEQISALKNEKILAENELNELTKTLIYEYADTRDYSNIKSEEIKNEIALLTLKQKEMIKDNKAFMSSSGSTSKQAKEQIKQITKCFTSEVNEIFSKLTLSNIEAQRGKIVKSFESLNKIFSIDNVEISKDFLESKLEELTLNYHYILKLKQEEEDRKAEQEVLREEAKVRREIEIQKAKIEKELTQFKNEANKLMGYLNKANNDVERQLYLDKIKELEEKVSLLEKDKEDVLNREQNTRAGYVYIISNIGSFGENIYKIGVTRRLEPMDRIRELSSASVPFEFDVHALIFSEDAPHLEAVLHNHFRDKMVNRVNFRKEFFNIDLEEAKKVVLENHNNTVDFTMEAQALEYRQSLEM